MSNGEYDNTLRGALFVNKDKRTPNHPDYKGTIETEDGQEYWASGWIKEARNGSKYVSIALTPKDGNDQVRKAVNTNTDAQAFLENNASKIDQHRPQPQQAPRPDHDSFDDDIPF